MPTSYRCLFNRIQSVCQEALIPGGLATHCPSHPHNSSCIINSWERRPSRSTGSQQFPRKKTTALISGSRMDSFSASSLASPYLALLEHCLHAFLRLQIPALLHKVLMLKEHHQHPLAPSPPTPLLLDPPLLLPPHLQHPPHNHSPLLLLLLLPCNDTIPDGGVDKCDENTTLAVARHQFCTRGGRFVHPSQVQKKSESRSSSIHNTRAFLPSSFLSALDEVVSPCQQLLLLSLIRDRASQVGQLSIKTMKTVSSRFRKRSRWWCRCLLPAWNPGLLGVLTHSSFSS